MAVHTITVEENTQEYIDINIDTQEREMTVTENKVIIDALKKFARIPIGFYSNAKDGIIIKENILKLLSDFSEAIEKGLMGFEVRYINK